MWIKKIEINNFGGLKDFALNLKSGFNIIEEHNEYGKTTIMSFLYLMFYGKTSGDKSPDVSKNLRKKYRPWNGEPMEGRIVFESDGTTYSLYKLFGKGPGSDVVQLIIPATGEVAGLGKDEEIGKHFFGLDAEGFEKTIFTGSTGGFLGNGNEDSIGLKLSNMVTAGDEKVSAKLVMGRLSDAREKLCSRSQKSGLLVEKRKECADIRAGINEAVIKEEKGRNLLTRINALKDRIKELEKNVSGTALGEQYTAGQIRELQHRKEELESKFSDDFIIIEQDEYEKFRENRIKKTTNKELLSRYNERKSPELLLIPAIIGIVAGIVLIFLGKNILASACLTAGAACILIFFVTRLSGRKLKARALAEIKEAENELISFTEETGYGEDEVENAYIRSVEALKARKTIKELEKRILELSKQSSAENDFYEELSEKRDMLTELQFELRECDVDTQALRNRLSHALEKQNELEFYDKALLLAMECMEEASAHMAESFGPVLNDKASEFFEILTDGRYKSLTVDRNYGIYVKDQNKAYREWKYLSSGTIDQAYLSLRLALLELITDGKNKPPILLDDALSQYDGRRREAAMALLQKLSDRYQIILGDVKK